MTNSTAGRRRAATPAEYDVPTREPRELKTREIGAFLMEKLKEVDQVAFVRFASVYRRFEDAGDFVEEVETLLSDARDLSRRSR